MNVKKKNTVKFRFPQADKMFSMHFDAADVGATRPAYKVGAGQSPEVSNLLVKTMLRRTNSLRKNRDKDVGWDAVLAYHIEQCANVNITSAVNE